MHAYAEALAGMSTLRNGYFCIIYESRPYDKKRTHSAGSIDVCTSGMGRTKRSGPTYHSSLLNTMEGPLPQGIVTARLSKAPTIIGRSVRVRGGKSARIESVIDVDGYCSFFAGWIKKVNS